MKVSDLPVVEAVLSNGTFASVYKLKAYEYLNLSRALTYVKDKQDTDEQTLSLLLVQHLVSFDGVKLTAEKILNMDAEDYLICCNLAMQYSRLTFKKDSL